MLVFFRVLQGFGAGALQPTEQAILRQTFPPEEQGMAMAVFGMAVVLGPAFGPTLGGYIVDNYSWPWIFFINIPIGLLSLVMVTRFVHEPEDVSAANRAMAETQKKNMDWLGIALLFVGLGTLQYVLEEGNRNDWFHSTEITALAFLSVVALTALVIRELSAPVPAVDFSLFRDVIFLSGHARRRGDVRDADGGDVPPAAVHAADARLHGDAGGPGDDAALAVDDRVHADRRAGSTTKSRHAW